MPDAVDELLFSASLLEAAVAGAVEVFWLLEIAVLPLVFGLWQIAVLFSLLNAAVLAIRIRAENRALSRLRG